MTLDFKEATSPIQNTIDFNINTIDFNNKRYEHTTSIRY